MSIAVGYLGCGPKQPPDLQYASHFYEGDKCYERGDYGKAIDHYKKALRISDINPEIYRRLAFCMEQTEQLDSAVYYYEGAIVYNPKDSDSYQRIGDIYFRQKMYHDAMTWYDRAHELGYLYSSSYVKLGTIFYRTLEFDRSLRYYDMAVVVDSANALGYYGKGLALLAVADTSTAEDQFIKAIEVADHAPSMFILGIIEFKRGDLISAKSHFERYLQLAPEGKYVAEANNYLIDIRLGLMKNEER